MGFAIRLLPRIVVAAVLISAAASSAATSDATAEPLAAPTGEVLLTVTGDIARTNDGDTAALDIDLLRQIGSETFTTTTIWTDGSQTFTGTPLYLFVQSMGITEGDIVAVAINDYAVNIPLSDAVEGGPIIAFERNGKPMSVRDKGPLWIVYPYDSKSSYSTEQVYSRSIWQLVRIDASGNLE